MTVKYSEFAAALEAAAALTGTETTVILQGGLPVRLLVSALAGENGREVALRKGATAIEWQYVGDTDWTSLVPLADIEGDPGASVELQTNATHVQWRVVGADDWIDLIALAAITGPAGQGVPTGGMTGQVLAKISGTSFATQWITVLTIPAGGADGDFVVKNGEEAALIPAGTVVKTSGNQSIGGKKDFAGDVSFSGQFKLPGMFVIPDAPASGVTVALNAGVGQQTIKPAADLAALTVKLPDWTDTGFDLTVFFDKRITALTVTGGTQNAGVSAVVGAPLGAFGPGALQLRYFDVDNTWRVFGSHNAVNVSGDQVVGGLKEFSTSPTVPTPPAGVSSQAAANMAALTDALKAVIGFGDGANLVANPMFLANSYLPTADDSVGSTAFVDASDPIVPANPPCLRLGVSTKKQASSLYTTYFKTKSDGAFFSVVPGEVIDLSVWMCCTGNLTTGNATARLVLNENNIAGGAISNTHVMAYDNALGGWQKLTVSHTVGANVYRIRSGIWNETQMPVGGAIFFGEPCIARRDAPFMAIQRLLAAYAPLASPPLTGTPTSTTPAATDNSTRIQTSAGSLAQMGQYGIGATSATTDANALVGGGLYSLSAGGVGGVAALGSIGWQLIHAPGGANAGFQVMSPATSVSTNRGRVYSRQRWAGSWTGHREFVFTDNPSFTGTMTLGRYTLSTLPSAASASGALIEVTDATGGSKTCKSNATVWQILNTTTTVS